MKYMKIFFPLLFIGSLFFTGCVPTQQFQKIKAEKETCANEVSTLKQQNLELSENQTELKSDLETLNKKYQLLLADTISQAHRIQAMQERLNNMHENNNKLMELFKRNQKGNNKEVKKLLEEIQQTQNNLQERENDLLKAEQELNSRRKKLEYLQAQLSSQSQQMQLLQKSLQQKEQVVKSLKQKVKKALVGFEGDELTISTKRGKVYVSMQEKLLFKSGSYNIDKRGAEALRKLKKVLENNPNINIMIEGHTDNIPYKGKGVLKDNWDLSVKRATTVVRLLAKNNPKMAQRLSVVGRSKYLPIADNSTATGRRKNRRTEIILTPNLDEVFKLLE